MRFSIKFILFVMLVFAILLSGFTSEIMSRQRAKALVEDFGGEFWDENMTIPGRMWNIDPRNEKVPRQKESKWLQAIVGEGYTNKVRAIKIQLKQPDVSRIRSLLSQHAGLKGLDILEIRGPATQPLTSKNLKPIHGLSDLRFLSLCNAKLDRSFFESLSKIEDLEYVWLAKCDYDVEDLLPLAANPNLAWVKLGRDDFDQESLDTVRREIPNAYLTLRNVEPGK